MGDNNFFDRIEGVVKIDQQTYEEIGKDKAATKQALVIVFAFALMSALVAYPVSEEQAILAGLGVLFGWLAISAIAHVYGIIFSEMSADHLLFGRTLRIIGFSHAPGLLILLALIPGVGLIIPTVLGIWMLITMFVAIKEALYLSTGVTCLGFILLVIGATAISIATQI